MSANKNFQSGFKRPAGSGCTEGEIGWNWIERKEKILKAIIQNYLETGEPVGSRTISKYSDLKLSSATIRNEMSDLEELGYIIQPHTSAGRIPSDKGYRFYVDQLIHEKETEVTQVRDMVIREIDRVELLLKQMASFWRAIRIMRR